MSDDEIAKGVGSLLTAARGVAVPRPDSVMRHPWTTDPHFLVEIQAKIFVIVQTIFYDNMLPQCGFSYPRLDSGQTAGDWARLLAPLPRPQLPRLLLAGEHTSRHSFKTIHGARDSGLAQAQAIVDTYQDAAQRGQSDIG